MRLDVLEERTVEGVEGVEVGWFKAGRREQHSFIVSQDARFGVTALRTQKSSRWAASETSMLTTKFSVACRISTAP